MTSSTRSALAIAVVLLGLALTSACSRQSRRTTEEFVGHIYHQRYEQANHMLLPPSAIEVAPDGTLILMDQAGETTMVPASKLPFVVGGHDSPEYPCDFVMTALGSSTNGILDSPAVTLYLSLDGSEVCIEGVDP